MSTKQSSVEWFIDQLEEKGKAYAETVGVRTVNICIDVSEYMELKQQAKAMHKEEIENAFVECWKANMPDGYECKLSANEYYNETYAGGEQ